ncbi:CPBP family intramembrane metalloprotease [Salinadaptatus halalkaliphilus]|uniref:CPBP family intramembrane metalloprotease n=1 Tax=Salinadaptatus halalkaliphilus TaxID=2419781 RepID=A0A4V3VLA7_9EURY|nr:CPBP family intramembrane glutamic endopeptidase [Salinadaptatus halalkaliphilus]THE64917.1 CPBP family intramembrane metalloprotease [Salinadaptatus halalkaliphilus]
METTRSEPEPETNGAVAGVGAVAAAVTVAAVAQPLQTGLEEPTLWAAAGLAIVAIAAFLAGRYELLDSTVAGAGAAVSSVGVVVLAAYALNQGTTGGVDVGVLPWSVPLVFAGVLTAGVTGGVAVAYATGVDLPGLASRTLWFGGLLVFGYVGLEIIQLVTGVLAVPVFLTLESPTDVQLTILTQIGMVVGTTVVVAGYFAVRELELSYLDVRVPTIRDAIWTVAGLVVIFGALFLISAVFYTTGVESAEHGTAQQAEQDPRILLVLIPASILVIGPFEELLYRNVIQKSLYERFSRYGAVVVGSVIFAAVHVLAYATAGAGEVIASLAVVFGLSIVLGTIYERTENLLVPSLVHGIYNAILFANLYLSFV